MDHSASWRDRRSHDAAGQVRRLAERQAAESAQARTLIAGFLEAAAAAGIAPVPLQARGFGSNARYRTGLTGWYLRVNESAAIDTDGNFYLTTVHAGLRARVTGVHLEPSEPPLILGKGARDGESIDLKEALERILERHRR